MKKKKLKKVDVPIQAHLTGGLPAAELQKLVELEYEMALQVRDKGKNKSVAKWAQISWAVFLLKSI